MDDLPPTKDLLMAAQRFLDEEVVPELAGRRQFLVRVTANALRMAAREIATADVRRVRTEAGLAALLGEGVAQSADAMATLAERVRGGDFDAGAARIQLLTFLRSEVRDKLSVSNPRLLDADAARGIK
ncbi:MAG: DUF6285 domain-containing protein [bacterium]